MSMRIAPWHKTVIVAPPTAAWLTQSDAGTWTTIGVVVGAAYLAFIGVLFAWPPLPVVAAPVPAATAARICSEPRHGAAEHRISRRPTRRGPRDLRCPASRATARARRSTRR